MIPVVFVALSVVVIIVVSIGIVVSWAFGSAPA